MAAKAKQAQPAKEEASKTTRFSLTSFSRRSSTWVADDLDEEDVDIVVEAEENRIVMPLDASEHSFYLIHYYLKKIHRPENIVYACFVSDDFIHGTTTSEGDDQEQQKKFCICLSKKGVDIQPSPGVLADLRKRDRMNCIRVKHRVKHLFNTNEVTWEFERLRGRDVGATILEHTKKVGGSLIIMGNRGNSGLKRTVYGSVSQKVLDHSLVPVLIVKKPMGAMQSETAEKETLVH